MLRRVVIAVVFASSLASAGWAQSPATGNPPAATAPAPSAAKKPIAKKPAKARAAVRQPAAAVAAGPCRLGVIAALGSQFSVQHFGLTVFENTESKVSVDWGLDELVLARVRAATGSDPAVRSIAYPNGAFEPYYNPKSRILPDPHEGLPAIVRSFTADANCERYLVVTRFDGVLPGTQMRIDGIGALSRGIGSLLTHAQLFANISIAILDGRTYERINRPFANIGTHFTDSLRLTEDPLIKLDNSQFPNPPESASGNATLRERTRALVAATLDKELPGYLKDQ